MFSKVALFTVAVMAAFVAAAPAPGGINNSCNTGPVQCCKQVVENDSPHATILASLLGLDLGAITGQVGLQCSPLSVIGIGSGSSCSSEPVCCSDNTFKGLIVVGCSPINLNL